MRLAMVTDVGAGVHAAGGRGVPHARRASRGGLRSCRKGAVAPTVGRSVRRARGEGARSRCRGDGAGLGCGGSGIAPSRRAGGHRTISTSTTTSFSTLAASGGSAHSIVCPAREARPTMAPYPVPAGAVESVVTPPRARTSLVCPRECSFDGSRLGVGPISTYPRIHVSTYPRIHVSVHRAA